MNREECIDRLFNSFGMEKEGEEAMKFKYMLAFIPTKTLHNTLILKALRDPNRPKYLELAAIYNVSIDTIKRMAKKRVY